MTLQEFVTETLLHIARGVADAQKLHDTIAPRASVPDGNTKALVLSGGKAVFIVEFDVAVRASEKSQTGGKGDISVVQVFKAGGEHSHTTEESSVNRVKFTVPIEY